MSFEKVKKEILEELSAEFPVTDIDREARLEGEGILEPLMEFRSKMQELWHNLQEIKIDNLFYMPSGSYLYWVKVTTDKKCSLCWGCWIESDSFWIHWKQCSNWCK